MSKVNPDQIFIEKIKILCSEIRVSEEIKNQDGVEFKLTFKFRPGVNIELKKARLIFECTIASIVNNTPDKYQKAYFKIDYEFEVKNLNELARVSQAIEIDSGLMVILANIAFSTSRGIIYDKCQGTPFQKAILPIVSYNNIREMIEPENY